MNWNDGKRELLISGMIHSFISNGGNMSQVKEERLTHKSFKDILPYMTSRWYHTVHLLLTICSTTHHREEERQICKSELAVCSEFKPELTQYKAGKPKLISYLSCHDKAGCWGINGDIASDKSNIFELFIEFTILLVTKSLDRGRINDSLLILEWCCNTVPESYIMQ